MVISCIRKGGFNLYVTKDKEGSFLRGRPVKIEVALEKESGMEIQ